MEKVTNEDLLTLIEGLEEYKSKGVIDPWVLSDGSIIEPLDVLKELYNLRMDNLKLTSHSTHANPQ